MAAKFELRFTRQFGTPEAIRSSTEVETAEDLDEARAKGRALRQRDMVAGWRIVGDIILVKCQELERF